MVEQRVVNMFDRRRVPTGFVQRPTIYTDDDWELWTPLRIYHSSQSWMQQHLPINHQGLEGNLSKF